MNKREIITALLASDMANPETCYTDEAIARTVKALTSGTGFYHIMANAVIDGTPECDPGELS